MDVEYRIQDYDRTDVLKVVLEQHQAEGWQIVHIATFTTPRGLTTRVIWNRVLKAQ